MSNQKGGAKEYSGIYRHFKIIELNGKAVKYDNSASIKEHQTPLNAAKKLLKSVCLQMGLKGMKKLECHATYIIQETTRGSKKKIYGPYKGKYVKYSPEEAKKAMASGISFKMKPVVKLHKHGSPKKGGFGHFECLNPKCEYYKMSVQKYNLPGGVCPGCGKKVSAFQ